VSPGGSLTASLDHAVSWFSRLLTAHVYPAPHSETWKPKPGLAITLIHGAGVHCPGFRTITYSRPSCAKPPRPLNSSRSSAGLVPSAVTFAGVARRGGPSAASG